MNVLLTGANGQLGQDFQKMFKNEKVDFIATDYREGNGCIALDITDASKLNEFFKNKKIDIIINCAAYNNVDGAESDRAAAIKLNCEAPKLLATIAKNINAKFITYSTDFVFKGDIGREYLEEDATTPISAYGESKAMGEVAVRDANNEALIIRTSWVFGMGNDNFVKKVIKWSDGKQLLKVVDDEISSPTYSWDLAVYSWKLIKKNKSGMYHISNAGKASRNDFAKYILSKTGWTGTVETAKQKDFALPASRPFCSKLSLQKVENDIGEKIPDWKNAVDRFLEELKKSN